MNTSCKGRNLPRHNQHQKPNPRSIPDMLFVYINKLIVQKGKAGHGKKQCMTLNALKTRRG
jgi:hypothetical protein